MTATHITAQDLARVLRRAGPLHLSANTLHALCILHSLEGAITMSDLARHVGVSCAAITGIADVLEISGLLGRHRHRSDRRLVYVHLTEHGKNTVSEILNA